MIRQSVTGNRGRSNTPTQNHLLQKKHRHGRNRELYGKTHFAARQQTNNLSLECQTSPSRKNDSVSKSNTSNRRTHFRCRPTRNHSRKFPVARCSSRHRFPVLSPLPKEVRRQKNTLPDTPLDCSKQFHRNPARQNQPKCRKHSHDWA